MKKFIKSVISILIVMSITSTFFAYAEEKPYVCKKGDKKLIEAVGSGVDTTVPVSVFFSTIDYTEAEDITKARLQGKVSGEIINIAFNGGMSTSLSQEEAERQMNTVVDTENAVIKELTQSRTQEMYSTVFTEEKPQIISCGAYTPNINMYMTESQIQIADQSPLVTQMRYVNPSIYENQKAPIKVSSIPYFVQAPKTLTSGRTWTIKVSNGSKAKWTTSNKYVATVSNGKIIARSKGTAIIKAEFSTGIIVSCKVTVTTSPRLSRTSVTVKRGRATTIKLSGKSSSLRNIYYNTKYAKFASYTTATTLKIQGLRVGTSTLRVKVNGVKTLSVKVKVIK